MYLKKLYFCKKIIMEKEFIPYEQSLVLKELGFNEFCFAFYTPEQQLIIARVNCLQSIIKGAPTAPLYQQAFRWFREKYGLEGYVNLSDSKEGNYFYYFNYINTNNIASRREHCGFFIGKFKTYEETELECLKKLIEIAQAKNTNTVVILPLVAKQIKTCKYGG